MDKIIFQSGYAKFLNAMLPVTVDYNGYTITTDKNLMKVSDVHRWLSEVSYWSKGIPFETFNTSFDNSYCIGVLIGDKQIGFARLITDYAVFGYLADVYVEETHRGKGISKKMLDILFDMDWVQGLRGIKLATADAHGLYERYGFTECKHPERIMEISRPDIYKPTSQTN
jgi:GNAT superfamily N-acetyltransferase